MQLILTPVDPGVSGMVPWSYFTNLSTEERSSPEIWFTSHIAPLYYFEIYGSRVEIGNVSYAETMLVRIGRRRSPLNVATETKVIRAAMSQPWIVRLKGRTFVFTAKFYRHAKYITDGFMPEFEIFVDQDVTESVNQGKSASVNEGKHPPTIYELLETEFIDTPDTVLKKTHFCDRIRLSQSEWSGRGQDLYLNLGSEVSKGEEIMN